MKTDIHLSEIATYRKGKPTPKRLVHALEQMPLLTPEYLRRKELPELVSRWMGAVTVENGQLVLLWDGSNAGEFFRAKRGVLASTMVVFNLDSSEFDQDYLYYALKSFEPTLKAQTQGSGIPHVDKEILLGYKIRNIEKPNQTQIAAVLWSVDHAIEQAESISTKYQRIKTGLMHDLLTRGIDEHGQLRDPATHKFKTSPLGLIPYEWEVSNVNKEFSVGFGFTLGPHRQPKLHPRKYLRVANVQRDVILLEDISELEAQDNEMEQRTLQVNDLLVVEGHADPDEIGRCAIVPIDGAGLTFQNHLFRLRCNRIDPRFALAWLNSGWVRGYWKRNCGTSSGLNTINRTMLGAVSIPIPDEWEQNAISDLLNEINLLLQQADSSLIKLQRLKTGLMQDLLTGEVSVEPLLEQR